jgi:hypothetical protein
MIFSNKIWIPGGSGPARPAAMDPVQPTADRRLTVRAEHVDLSGSAGYDALDHRLIDTFPASDAVACY